MLSRPPFLLIEKSINSDVMGNYMIKIRGFAEI